MEFKARFLKWSAGVPVIIINQKSAEKLGIEVNDRVLLKKVPDHSEEMHVIVDVIKDLIKPSQVAVSQEVQDKMNLKRGQKIELILAESPKSLQFIKDKLNNKMLTQNQIMQIIDDIVSNALSEAEIALFVSAMYKSKMSMKEVTYLIKAISKTGNSLNLNKKYVVDKHCIGGIPGNRTTPLVVSICAAAGLIIPKTSSRAITSPAGTADVIEAIADIDFPVKELKKIVMKTNGCMVWGGGLGLVPADSKIIHIEKTLKIDPQSQLLASIMSKKLSVGSNYILIDIPYGKTAKVNKKKALELKRKFQYLGRYFNKKLKVVLTDGSQPIGNGIGPILELIDIVSILEPTKKGPRDLEEKAIFLSAQILELSGKFQKGEGKKLAREILNSGEAFKKFKEIIKAQNGDIKKLDCLEVGKYKKTIYCKKGAKVLSIDNKAINQLARVAGCPADKKAGLYLHCKKGDVIKKKDPILTIYAETWFRLRGALTNYKQNSPIKIK